MTGRMIICGDWMHGTTTDHHHCCQRQPGHDGPHGCICWHRWPQRLTP